MSLSKSDHQSKFIANFHPIVFFLAQPNSQISESRERKPQTLRVTELCLLGKENNKVKLQCDTLDSFYVLSDDALNSYLFAFRLLTSLESTVATDKGECFVSPKPRNETTMPQEQGLKPRSDDCFLSTQFLSPCPSKISFVSVSSWNL